MTTYRQPVPAGRFRKFVIGFLQREWQREKLAAAALLIALVFLIGNDRLRAQEVISTNRHLFSNKRVINYLDARNRWSPVNMVNRNRIYGKARLFPDFGAKKRKVTPSFTAPLAGGDTCPTATIIPSLPYSDSGTTAGAIDNYDLPADVVSPTVTGCPTCTATGGGPASALPRGAVYTSTGTAPDVAYRITFAAPGSMGVVVAPTGSADLSLIVYTNVCSSNLADAIVVDDTGTNGSAEGIVISSLPAGTYHIVVDGYSGSSGTYNLSVSNGTSAAGVTVGGKVISKSGRGLKNVRVTATDLSGQVRTATTNTFGFYRFEDLPSGSTYTFTVSSKKHSFDNPTQTVSVTDHVADLNFTATE